MRVEDIEDGVCPISLGFVKLPTNLFSTGGREHRDLLPDHQSDDDVDDEEEDEDDEEEEEETNLVMAWLPCLTVTVGNAATSGNDFLRCIAELPTA